MRLRRHCPGKYPTGLDTSRTAPIERRTWRRKSPWVSRASFETSIPVLPRRSTRARNRGRSAELGCGRNPKSGRMSGLLEPPYFLTVFEHSSNFNQFRAYCILPPVFREFSATCAWFRCGNQLHQMIGGAPWRWRSLRHGRSARVLGRQPVVLLAANSAIIPGWVCARTSRMRFSTPASAPRASML